MGNIDYKAIYETNRDEWKALTRDPHKYEALLAGHYSDSNHFVYELLQNAEDAFEINSNGVFDPQTCAHAEKVVIEYYADKLVFYHSGKPFDEKDVRGVSSMLMGTKDKDDAQTIGRFGMGFKSVFKYTYQPEIYSDNEAFKITNYLLPIEITEGWDYQREKESIVCKLGDGRSIIPFKHEKHLTKIVIPFLKYGKDQQLEAVPGDDVLKKLNDLSGEILLFLTHIKTLYWINNENGTFAYITMSEDEKDSKLFTCRIEGTKYGQKEEIARYLKFKKTFDHPDMDNAEVSVAYRLNSRADNINEVDDSPVWVYFPTKDDTDLPFLIHGSFETAVSREKLMEPSSFNDDLFDELGNLIANSMKELAKRKLITQAFIRKILIPAFTDEDDNNTIPGLKEKTTRTIALNNLLPDKAGNYRSPESMMLPLPFRMGDFAEKRLIGKAFDNKIFVAFNNERESNFSEYYNWLTDDLGIRVYRLSDLAKDLKVLDGAKIPTSGELFDVLKSFYDFLSDNRESIYDTGLSYTRSGPYESAIRRDLKEAWDRLREAPLILNRLNTLVPAMKDGKPAIYLGSSSEYKSVMQSAIVNRSIAGDFVSLLRDGFKIEEFNNFQYIKEKVIQKYIDIGDTVGFVDNDNFTAEYVEDINQILMLLEESGDPFAIREMLQEAYIIKVKPEDDQDEDSSCEFCRPKDCYVPLSDEGIDLNVYYSPIPYGWARDVNIGDKDYWNSFRVYGIDKTYYEENGIAISKLAKLGLITTPVSEGKRTMNGVGDGYWIAQGEYCPSLTIDALEDNIKYIQEHSEEDLAKEKSVEILKLLLSISGKMRGKRRRRKTNPYIGDVEEIPMLTFTIKQRRWLFDSNMNLCSPKEMSRFELNPVLYAGINAKKDAYEILGFVEKEGDEAEETLHKASNLNRQDKRRLLRWLAKDLGLQVSEAVDEKNDWEEEQESLDLFNPNEFVDDEFPVNRINNKDYLVRHVQEQFYCADPTTYRKVWRQIRVSKNAKADRSYAIGMYTNSSNIRICQMCRKAIAFIEVDQIANLGIEMPQLNLCLCRDCSATYRTIRDGNKEAYKEKIKSAIMSIEEDAQSDTYAIELNDRVSLHFTQTHIAEIKEILKLLSEYGTPSDDADVSYDNDVTGPLMHPARSDPGDSIIHNSPEEFTDHSKQHIEKKDDGIARDGSFISYKKKFANHEVVNNTLQPRKYPLHKEFIGHRAGDTITFMCRQYELLSVIN